MTLPGLRQIETSETRLQQSAAFVQWGSLSQNPTSCRGKFLLSVVLTIFQFNPVSKTCLVLWPSILKTRFAHCTQVKSDDSFLHTFFRNIWEAIFFRKCVLFPAYVEDSSSLPRVSYQQLPPKEPILFSFERIFFLNVLEHSSGGVVCLCLQNILVYNWRAFNFGWHNGTPHCK